MKRAPWIKSTRSGDTNCVEVQMDEVIRVRDSKQDDDGPILAFPRDAWAAFVSDVKAGRFDLT